VPAPDPGSLEPVKTFFIRFFHDEPIDDEGTLSALRTLRGHGRQRFELSEAFDTLLAADVEPGFWTDFVRRYANRAATSDEQAREFVAHIQRETALDDVLDPDE
jgi:hypothetical protein